MAGYGGLGGLGGFSYPTRRGIGMPNSTAVQSDQEFHKEWADKAPQAYSDPYAGVQTVAGADGYNPMAASPIRNDIINSQDTAFVNAVSSGASADQMAGLQAALEFARNAGVTLSANPNREGAAYGIGGNPYTDRGAAAFGGSHTVSDSGPTLNPEYSGYTQQYQDATRQRTENQIRQQQAYDGPFMGNGAIGGVMPSSYTNANFGQVTGQKTGGLGGLGGADLTSVDQTQQTGAYMGGAGSYNPNPFSPGSFKSQNPWSGF